MSKKSSLAQKELTSNRNTKYAMLRKAPKTSNYFHSSNLQSSSEGTIDVASSDLLPILKQQMSLSLWGPGLRLADVEEPTMNVNCVGSRGQHAENTSIGISDTNGTSTRPPPPPREVRRHPLLIGADEGEGADGNISKRVEALKQRMQNVLSEVLTEADGLEAERAITRLRMDFMLADALASESLNPESTPYSPSPGESFVDIARSLNASSVSNPDRSHLVDSGRIFPVNGSTCSGGAALSAVRTTSMSNKARNTIVSVFEEELEQVRTERRDQRRQLFQESSKYQRVGNGQGYSAETRGAIDVSGSPQPRVYVRGEKEMPVKRGKADIGGVLPKTIPTFESEAKMIPPPSPFSVLAYHPPQRGPPWGAAQQVADEAALSRGTYAAKKRFGTETSPPEDQSPLHVDSRSTKRGLLVSAKKEGATVADELVCRADFWENVDSTFSRSTHDGVSRTEYSRETSVVERYCPHCKKDLLALAMGSDLSTTVDAGGNSALWHGEKGRSKATSSRAPTRDTANLKALLHLHPPVCAYRKVQCKACGEAVTARFVADHDRQCSSRVFSFEDDH